MFRWTYNSNCLPRKRIRNDTTSEERTRKDTKQSMENKRTIVSGQKQEEMEEVLTEKRQKK